MTSIETDQIDTETWSRARQIVRAGLRSSLHCSIASVNPDGTPHVTPIGSVMLAADLGRGIYLDIFNARLARNINANPAVCVLAVDSRKRTWLRALLTGHFKTPPGMQLIGTVAPRREATDSEIRRFQRAVKPLLNTKGGRALWQHERVFVRDLSLHSIRDLRLGTVTAGASSG